MARLPTGHPAVGCSPDDGLSLIYLIVLNIHLRLGGREGEREGGRERERGGGNKESFQYKMKSFH